MQKMELRPCVVKIGERTFETDYIDARTWEQGRRKPPDYIPKLLERIWNLETTSQ